MATPPDSVAVPVPAFVPVPGSRPTAPKDRDPAMPRTTPVPSLSVLALFATLAVALATRSVAGQDLVPTLPAPEGPVLLAGAAVHTVTGEVFDPGALAFADGVITWVGPLDALPSPRPRDETRIDLSGRRIYPGLIGANTIMGLIEIESVRATRDDREVGEMTPEVRVISSINPDSTIIPVTRSNGVLVCAVLPVGGLLPGRGAAIRLDGWTWEDLAIEADLGLVVNWPDLRPSNAWWSTRSADEQIRRAREQVRSIETFFDEAKAWMDARDAGTDVGLDLQFEALRPVVEGRIPILVRANRIEQMRSAIRFAGERGLRMVIVGGAEADLVADDLLRHDVPVIVTGTHRLPSRRDLPHDDAFTLPARLEAAGVRWCLASSGGSFETPHERNLPYHAATAVAYGLDPQAGLASITIRAAEILGIDDRYGAITEGRSATVFVCDGDPLEITTRVERAWIDGRPVDLDDKQKALARKYREKYRQLAEEPSEGNGGGGG